MELRRTFNKDAYLYDEYRPEYPDELFTDIISYTHIERGSKLLEIGVGTGQATRPFLELGCDIIGIELGDQLSSYVRDKYKDYDNFKVINDDFMSYPIEENSYDFIYCATAFHWLPKEEAYTKIRRALKKDGTLALFWNHPYPNREDDRSNLANQRIYQKYRPSDEKQIEFSEKDCNKYRDELVEFGFQKVESKLYRRVRTLQTEEYIQLLNTYSDHIALRAEVKEKFEGDMRKAIDEVGGRINIYDTLDLYLGKTE
ncbi:methyltransferase [Lachnospiraceae bacterium KM106-2]|nr:methyltransferase [Lachnospiraceae bacterium KM106-2]